MANINALERAFDNGFRKFLRECYMMINIPDLPPYFKKSVNVKFKPKQIVDRVLVSKRKNLAFELKKTASTLISLSRIKKHQIEFLIEFDEKCGNAFLIAGFFKEKSEVNVYLIEIKAYQKMIKTLGKKSFNEGDLIDRSIPKIECEKLKKHYRLNLEFLI